jgi:hypothetical protein
LHLEDAHNDQVMEIKALVDEVHRTAMQFLAAVQHFRPERAVSSSNEICMAIFHGTQWIVTFTLEGYVQLDRIERQSLILSLKCSQLLM